MLNWSIRYSKILTEQPELFDPKNTVVEVGCGPVGIAQFLRRPVIGIEPGGMQSQSEFLTIREGSIVALPFQDGEIDYVICMDVMEHLPRSIRSRAVAELARICRRLVIISCPCHKWAVAGEKQLRAFFQRSRVDEPQWLTEHLDLELPTLQEIIQPIVETGLAFRVEGNETITQHYAGIALDWTFPEMGPYNEDIKAKSISASPLTGNRWDVFYSFVFTIDKTGSPLQREQQSIRSEPTRSLSDQSGAAIYAVYHKEFPVAHLGAIKAIFSGEYAAKAVGDQLTDRLRDGTSLPNQRWSEMSAIYRIWADGPRTPVVGFTHYRRQFDFRGFTAQTSMPDHRPRETKLSPQDVPGHASFFYHEAAVQAVAAGALIVARPHDTVETIFDHYGHHHSTADYLAIMNRATPGPLLGGFLEQLSSKALFANNMVLASWEQFSELCWFWFNYLKAFENEVHSRASSVYQQRDIAFLSERIFDAWVRYRRSIGTKVIEVPIFFLE